MSANKINTSKKLLFSALILLTLVLGMEFTFRVKYALDDSNWRILIAPFGQLGAKSDVEQKDGPLDFRYSTENSYTYFNTHEQKDYTVNFTNQGFFYHSLLERDDTSTYRIFCIGGSSTFGGQSYDETWPGYLEACLRSKYPGKRLEVINFGLPGLGLLEILENVNLRVLEYKPDLFIYYGGYNDADKPDCLRSERLGRNLARGIKPGSNTLPILVGIHKLLHRRWSYLYTYLLEKYELIKYLHAAGYADIKGYQQLLDKLLDICRQQEISLVLVSQVLDMPPYPAEFESISYADTTASDAFYRKHCGNQSGNHEVWVTFRQRTLLKLQQEFCRRNRLEFFELRSEFKDASLDGAPKFYDIVHLSSRANELLADLICRRLDLNGLRPPGTGG